MEKVDLLNTKDLYGALGLNEKMTFNFFGETDQEKRLNEDLFYTTLELGRYQDMTQELLDYVIKNNLNDVLEIIKRWGC